MLLAGLILILVALGGWLFRPHPAIDKSRVHPLLRGLDENAKCEWTSYADGGTKVIRVIQPDGTEVWLSMSNSLSDSFSERGDLYIGDIGVLTPAVKITGYDHAKYVVAKLLANSSTKGELHSEDTAILTKRFSDWVFLMFENGPVEMFEALRISL
jgi:hypothetical protein